MGYVHISTSVSLHVQLGEPLCALIRHNNEHKVSGRAWARSTTKQSPVQPKPGLKPDQSSFRILTEPRLNQSRPDPRQRRAVIYGQWR